MSKLEVDFLSCCFPSFALVVGDFFLCYGVNFKIFSNSDTCQLLFRQSIFPELKLFPYGSLFITYLCFCFNCTCRSVNRSVI